MKTAAKPFSLCKDYNLVDDPDEWFASACISCSIGCGVDIGVKNGKVVGVRGRAHDRVNKGRLGPKGMYAWQSITSSDRLTHPASEQLPQAC